MSTKSTSSAPHVLPLRLYLSVGAALLLLTVVTVVVAQIPLGGGNLVVALTIAAIKALLVAFFFMHLYYDRKLYFVIFAAAVVVLTVFIVFTMFDTLERGAIYDIKAQKINPKATIYDKPIFKSEDTSGHADTMGAARTKPPVDSTRVKQDSANQMAKPGH